MKIKYINEAFKKISDLKKDVDKTSSDEDLRTLTIKGLLNPMFNNENFQRICSSCFSKFIKCRYNYNMHNGLMNFKIESVTDDILNLSAEHYYFNKGSVDEAASNIYVYINEIESRTAEEINKVIDDQITKQFRRWCTHHDNILLNAVSKIHVNKIFLYANAPGNVNGVYPEKVLIRTSETKITNERESHEEILNAFEKLSKIFKFCIKYPVLLTNIVKLEKIDPNNYKYRIPEISQILSKVRRRTGDEENDPYMICKKYINSPKLQEYELNVLWTELDLYEYLKTKSIEASKINSGKFSNEWEKHIITDAEPDFLEKNKELINEKLNRAGSYASAGPDLGEIVKNIEFFAGVYCERVVTYNKVQSYDSYNSYSIVPYVYGKFVKAFSLYGDH